MSNNEKRVISKAIISILLGVSFILFIVTTIIPGINKENFYSLLISDKNNMIFRIIILALFAVSFILTLVSIVNYISNNKLIFYGSFAYNTIIALVILILDLHFVIFTTTIRIIFGLIILVNVVGVGYFIYLAKKDYECLFGVKPNEEVSVNNDNLVDNTTNEESKDLVEEVKEIKEEVKPVEVKQEIKTEEVKEDKKEDIKEEIVTPKEEIKPVETKQEIPVTENKTSNEVKESKPVEPIVNESKPQKEEKKEVETKTKVATNKKESKSTSSKKEEKPSKSSKSSKTTSKEKKKSSKKTALFARKTPVVSQELTKEDLMDNNEAKKEIIKDIKNDIANAADEQDIKMGIGKQKDFKKYFVTLIIAILALIGSYFAPIFIGEKSTLYPYYEFTSKKSYYTMALTIIYAIVITIILFRFVWLVVRRKERELFESRLNGIINFIFVFSILYFIFGLVYFLVNVLGGTDKGNTFTFIFPLLMIVILIFNAIIRSKYQKEILIVDTNPTIDYSNPEIDEEEEKEIKSLRRPFPSVELLIADIIFTLLPIACLFITLFKVSATGMETQTIKALDYITKFTQLTDPGFRVISFVLIICGGAIAMFFLLYMASFFGRQKKFYSLSTASIVTCMVVVTLIGLYGLYYKVVQANNKTQILLLIGQFAPQAAIETIESYKVETYSYFICLGAVIFLLVVLIRNPMRFAGVYDELDDRQLLEARLNATPLNNETLGEFLDNRLATIPSDINNENANLGVAGQPVVEEEEKPEEEKVEEEEKIEILEDFDSCPAFTELDSKAEDYKLLLDKRNEIKFEGLDLVKLTHFIINYAANSRLHLSYKYEDIAAFIAGLGCARLTILQGMSGTGKTSLPKIFMEAVYGNCEIIEIESSWREKNELLGFYNEFSKMYTPKKFTQCLYKASLNKEVVTFIVLDEMNLSRIEYYFSDFLSLMENEEDKREIKLSNVKLYNTYKNERHPYLSLKEDHTLKVPANVWFIGTANRDESTFEISDKVYDRAHTMNFNKRAPAIEKYGAEMKPKFMDYDGFRSILEGAKKTYKFDIEKNETIKRVEQLLIPFNISFGNRIYRQIIDFVKVYCSCYPDGKKVEFDAVETILLTKVVMKLENKNIENKELLVHEFEKLKLKRCAEFISKLSED